MPSPSSSHDGEVVLITGSDNLGAQATYRASGYADWALAMQKRFAAI